METIRIETGRNVSEIFVGIDRKEVTRFLPEKGCLIITDDNVKRLYSSDFPGFPVVSVPPGEESKKLEVIGMISEKALEAGLDRSGFVLAIGGGVVCDIAGFFASVFMRGIPFGFISTTLLSQVDASTGGKNGVNLGKIKNIIGSISQPSFVICDISMLETLEEDEFISGLAEVVKMALILDSGLLGLIEKEKEAILRRDRSVMKELVAASVRLKAQVVSADEREAGIRMILNFGHTFGHVIETESRMKHGLAVAAGMVIAAGISVKEGLLDNSDFLRIRSLLRDFRMIRNFEIDPGVMFRGISMDKKGRGDEISLILVEKPGRAVIRKTEKSKLGEYISLIGTWL